VERIVLEALRACHAPSQALWRACEVAKLRQLAYPRPVLELGCGSDAFGSLILDSIDDAIDINPAAVQRCKQKAPTVYKRVHCMDARHLAFPDNTYMTVFANSVLEHVPDLRVVLVGCFRVLRLGGQLVATFPLLEMNSHLATSCPWYVEARRKQLVHINLLTMKEWAELLGSVGFNSVNFVPYLPGRMCRYWDLLDLPSFVGYGRFTLSAAIRKATLLVPAEFREPLYARMAGFLARLIREASFSDACAAVVIARK